MISFFPTPYENELLFSLLSRYYKRSGNISPKSTLIDLFNSSTITASAELPSGIDALLSNMPMGSTWTHSQLIFNHTLYPVYTAFLPEDSAASIYQSMRSNDGKDIYNRAGLMASSIKSNLRLKFCPLCYREDYEMYWRREHQVVGVNICLKHHVWLVDSFVPFHQYNKHIFVDPSEENCHLNNVQKVEDVQLIKHYEAFIQQIRLLLGNRYPNRSHEWFTTIYKEKLIEKGYAELKGRVDQFRLHRDFFNFYGKYFLEQLQSYSNGDLNWLSEITRKHRKSFHPIRHLLFMKFSGLTMDDVFYGIKEYSPFGNSPFPCLNPVCQHFKKDVINDVVMTTCEKSGKVIGTFACNCGFIYTRKGEQSLIEDRFKVSRVKQYGKIWERELSNLLLKNLSYREIARRLNADPTTVMNYAKKNKEHIVINASCNDSRVYDKYRLNWLSLKNANPNSSKTELRKIAPSLYMSLYRNDRAWLNANSPQAKQSKVDNKRVDWAVRDNEIYELSKAAVKRILKMDGKPIRITVGRIGSEINKRSLLEKHIEKMPKTKEYLMGATESIKQFHKRRIDWAIRELERENEELVEWKIIRKASIRL